MRRKKALIVGDEFIVAEDLKNLVEAQGYKVELAKTGSEATKKLEKAAPDIILLDVSWDGLNDIETSGVIRHIQKTERIGVIFITSIPSKDLLESGYQRTVVIKKPFSNKEVARALSILETDRNLDGIDSIA